MSLAITVCLVIVGLINVAPVVGFFSASKMEKGYGVRIASNDMAILMRHRALLFGVLGGFILYAAFFPIYHMAAMVMAGVSMIGFAILVLWVGGYNASIRNVFITDLVGIVVLLAAALLKFFES